MLRKITGILLLACLIAPFGGFYVFLQLKKKQVKKDIRLNLASFIGNNNLVVFSFSKEDIKTLEWKDNHEFEYEGQMYDIIESNIVGETIHYKCFHDTKETSLNKKIEQLIARITGSNPQKKENQERLISFIKIQYMPTKELKNVVKTFSIKKKFFIYNEFGFNEFYNPPPAPPPKTT
ncbi:MAG: hypothetical protein R2750_08740 [Bacteroidales bacterium]